jgi:hypothetical protein
MSVVTGLYYQQLKSTVSLPSVTGSTLYFTIPWYPQATVDQIRFWNTSATGMTVTNMLILNDGAHYRNSSLDNKGQVIYRDPANKSAQAADSYRASWEIATQVYTDNLYNRPFLNIQIQLTTSTTLTPVVSVIGKKALGSTILDTDDIGILVDKTYRVLIAKGASAIGGTGGTVYDITNPMTRRGGENVSQAGFATTTDYLYIGSTKPTDHFEFNLSGTATTAATLTMEFWNGSTWTGTGVSIIDNTSSGNSDTMRFSGIIENNGTSSGWTKTKLTGTGNTLILDPMTGLGTSITNGLVPPVGCFSDPERYWWRFSVNKIAGSGVSFASILPIVEDYL